MKSMRSSEPKVNGGIKDKIIADLRKELANFVTKSEYEDQKVEI